MIAPEVFNRTCTRLFCSSDKNHNSSPSESGGEHNTPGLRTGREFPGASTDGTSIGEEN